MDTFDMSVPYNHTIGGHKKCYSCGESPQKFPNELSRREYQEITGTCACCWELNFLEPDDASEEDIRHAEKVLLFYDRKFIMQKKLPHTWQCLKCEQYSTFRVNSFGNRTYAKEYAKNARRNAIQYVISVNW